MSKQLFLNVNLGVGDYLFARVFLDKIKDQYDNIYISLSEPAIKYWFNNDQVRWNFNIELSKLIFNEKPYCFVEKPRFFFPFFPHERIVKELNNKPVKPNLDHLCEGKSLNIEKYIVITTKIRQFDKDIFEQYKEKLTPALQSLATKYKIVILGEREVQKSIEYSAECNRNKIFGIYDYLIDIFKNNEILDLTIPALGITCSNIKQFRQDCLIMNEADAVITFGIGGNLWMSTAISKQTIGLRADKEWATDLIHSGYPSMLLTKDLNEFCKTLFDK